MRSKVTDNPSLRNALRSAHFSREKDETVGDWPFRVMKRVRAIGPVAAPGFWPDFERLVWRLAPVSCMLALALATLLLLNIGSGFHEDYLGTVTSELDQPTMVELLGLES
jgi:hypothetical protein